MSLNAISTNGQVRGGGAYYLISRSLGPEFGGSIGLIFFVGQALNAAMNVLGFVESLTDAFGEERAVEGVLPEGPWWLFAYGTVVLLVATLVCLVGSRLFARATLALAVILGVAILSIPLSSVLQHPFSDEERGAYYTGWAWHTMRENMFPQFTSGAAGSSKGAEKENWQSIFGVLFPAVTGILAGASMSGDLRKPSKSIPKGTNWSLGFTFVIYAFAFVILAGTVARESFYIDSGIVSDVSISPMLITFGALASTAFSALMGVLACAKVLQAIARDNLLPILDCFGQGTEVSDTPTFAILATYIFCQLILFVDSVNVLAQLVTMTTLLTFGTLSFATMALKAGGAPSFRPSFRYWNIWTALAGTISCFGAMFFTDASAAAACIVLAIFLFGTIHVFSPPKPWGDVMRNLNYFIVRKYLLRLDERKGHVKYWRPQVLLLANNPRTEWNLIIFCNSLKKGALYVLGHVIKGEFAACLPELRKQNVAWLKLVDISGIKSFVDIVIAQDEREGARNLALSCGLGGMRPNIIVMGFPDHMHFPARADPSRNGLGGVGSESEVTIRGLQSPVDEPGHRKLNINILPTDSTRREAPIQPQAYVGIMEDALALNKGLAIAYNFESLQIPDKNNTKVSEKHIDRYLDLWPVQIASTDSDPTHAWDTYTMILQLGTILGLTGTWKSHKLRVSVFVESLEDVEEERRRVRSLLDNLRIPAELRVFALKTSGLATYETIVGGRTPVPPKIESALRGDPWWETLKELRKEDERRAKAAKRRSKAVPPSPAAREEEDAAAASKRQSKREQKLNGVRMPAEHLAYFKRNIQIGLAHPKMRLNRGEESDGESDFDSDDDSDLSDELAGLMDEDWTSSGTSLRRSSTFAAGQKPKLTRARAHSIGVSREALEEPIRRPLLGSSPLASQSPEYGSMSSTPTPARLGLVPAPQLGVSVSSTTSSGTVKAAPAPGPAPFLSASSRTSSVASSRRSSFSSKGSDNDGTLKASDRAKIVNALDSNGLPDEATRKRLSHTRGFSDDDYAAGNGRSSPRPDADAPPPANVKLPDAPLISFNELPNKAQYLILNELIREHSSASTSVVLTALPAPDPGTSDDEVKSLRYLKSLHTLFSGGPPVLGVHAKTFTVSVREILRRGDASLTDCFRRSPQMTMSL